MKTVLTTSPRRAAAFIQRGEIVAFPTETVYGLGAGIFNETAIQRIFAAKGRPSDNPLIAHIHHKDQILLLARSISPQARLLIDRFVPGPLTLILPRNSQVPHIATGGLDTIGIRMPAHAAALAFLEACRMPLAAPSANRSGRPSPTTWQAVLCDMDGRIPCILKGNQAKVGLESTVVDCTTEVPVMLRAGAVTLEQLQEVLPETVMAEPDSEFLVRSPGSRYKHYAPDAKVTLVNHPNEALQNRETAYIGLEAPPSGTNFRISCIPANSEQYAFALFDFFRRCDEKRVHTIYCQRVEPVGIGRALMDRLARAAES